MASPTPTARQQPASGTWKMPEGFQALITFKNYPTVALWEKDVKAPGVTVGEPINTTTQQNTAWQTKAFSLLKELTDTTMTCAYDPDVYTTIIANLIGVNTTVTVTFPDGSTLCFYGGLREFQPTEFRIREFPLANLSITATNWDPVNNVEAAPVFTAAVGV